MTHDTTSPAPNIAPGQAAAADVTDYITAGHTSTADRRASGKELRKKIPRSRLAAVTAVDRDPIGILEEQNETRVQSLVPLRRRRMSTNPFSFFRGAAAVMASDLAADDHTGLLVASCGDAHISNFGFYASPQRTLVFDLNDFDESAWAPWEWDLKRLVTSVIIGGQAAGRSDEVIRDSAAQAVLAYAKALRATTDLSPYDRYFASSTADSSMNSIDPESHKVLEAAIAHAQKRTGVRAAKKLTRTDTDGTARFVDDPPTMTHLSQKFEDAEPNLVELLANVRPDVAQLLRNYTLVDVCRRVVGVGSVGTKCLLLLLQDGDDNSLILQPKQAQMSVLEQYGKIEQPAELLRYIEENGQGGRVVAMQQILQAVSDPLLGFLRMPGADFYIRQFHDMKGSIDVDSLDDVPFTSYAKACAVSLARAHSQSPNSAEISGYIGSGKALSRAIVDWCVAYAEQSNADYEAFLEHCKTVEVAPPED